MDRGGGREPAAKGGVVTGRPPASGPVRFRVGFPSPEALLDEYTRCVGRGSVVLDAARPLGAGSRLVFDLFARGFTEPVEVEAEVVVARPSLRGTWLLQVDYRPGRRGALDRLVYRVFDAQRIEPVRCFPRVPINARATEDEPYSPAYVIRDASLGGVGVRVEATGLPAQIQVGAPFLLAFSLGAGTLRLRGVVVWAIDPAGVADAAQPSFGVQFVEDLEFEALALLDGLLSLTTLPRRTRISFGVDAFQAS